jgi:hypothetical protein
MPSRPHERAQQKRKGKTMTKFETKQVAQVEVFIAHGMTDTAARSLSSLVRCARTEKSLRELLALAEKLNIRNHPDFIY